MTGYTVHTGSNEKFSQGWDKVFSGGKKSKTSAGSSKKTAKKSAVKSTAKKTARKVKASKKSKS
ncbi:MAG: hypothetical protein O2955_12965 [Planctomycetota bacterium]|nr:hypothetical protein [Planctomycetota bacterium]MDA1213420.1 hypothetical protein [Planctomycetota bacterium]